MALYVVATPIGNLRDMSQRAATVLKSVDCILAEDTRRTKKLLTTSSKSGVGGHFRLERLDEYTSESRLKSMLEGLKRGEKMALVTDAGTPGISDPGAKFVDMIYKNAPYVEIIPVPGPSAVTAALSVSGFRAERFFFRGYPPKKRKRKTFFKEIVDCPETQVFFSTPHGIVKDLLELKTAGAGEKMVFVAREMTKMHESYYRGNMEQVIAKIKSDPLKGEYVIVIS